MDAYDSIVGLIQGVFTNFASTTLQAATGLNPMVLGGISMLSKSQAVDIKLERLQKKNIPHLIIVSCMRLMKIMWGLTCNIPILKF